MTAGAECHSIAVDDDQKADEIKDETIAAKAEVIERQKELIELWKRKYHENWCTIL